MQIKSLLVIGSMAVIGLAFSSCSKDVTFDSNAAFEQQKSQYEANFIKKYGPVDPNQTWDFSTMTPVRGIPADAFGAATRAASGSVNCEELSDKMEVDKDFIDWMHLNMKAGANNVKKGNPFYLTASGEPFTVVPIFQGQATFYWQLYLFVYDEQGLSGQSFLVWEKGQKLEQKIGNTDFVACGPDDKIADNALAVRAPQYTINVPKDRRMYFYMLTWKNTQAYTDHKNYQARLSSLDNQMLSLDGAPKPTNVPLGNSVKIIGCEDNKNGDWDYEDLVFMIYSKEPPKTEIGEEEIRITKRYLVEDLGAVDDFDFNDIVVDMSIVYKERFDMIADANGGWVEDKTKPRKEVSGSRHQEAVVRALGGTINIKLLVGETEIWQKDGHYNIPSMINTGVDGAIDKDAVLARISNVNPNGSKPLWTWVPETNNIAITVVYPDGTLASNDKQPHTIKFQRKGEVPVIIAVDPNDYNPWEHERNAIDPSWWYE